MADIGICSSTKLPVRICYNTFGDPSNPCVLLVSGLGSTLLEWRDEFCEMIVSKGYFVVRYDNRDCGISTHFDQFRPPRSFRFFIPRWLSIGEGSPCYSLRDMADDGMKLLTTLGVERAHIVGASMGGMIVQTMAIHYPARVATLTIIYSHSSGPNIVKVPLGRVTTKPRSSAPEDILAYKIHHHKMLMGNYPETDEEVVSYAKRKLERCAEDPNGTTRQLWAIARAESRVEALRQVKCQTLILHGTQDCLIPHQNGEELAQLIPHSHLVIYPGMGHSLPRALWEDIVSHLHSTFLKGSG